MMAQITSHVSTDMDALLTDCISQTVNSMFGDVFDHPFLNINAITVSDTLKPIPVKWVEEIQIDEVVFKVENDFGRRQFSLGRSGAAWAKETGLCRLQDALARLDLPEDPSSSMNLEGMSKTELGNEKKRVKHELKRYDAAFRQQFSRLPCRVEKEPMRPLYTYYRKLKTLNGSQEEHDADDLHGESGRQRGLLPGGRRRSGRDSLDYGRGSVLRSSTGTVLEDLDEHGLHVALGGGESTGTATAQTRQSEREHLEQRLANLAAEKSTVRNKLQAYQEKFSLENNRKIRFHKDILPIEREYRTYKHLKEEIAKFQKQLQDLV